MRDGRAGVWAGLGDWGEEVRLYAYLVAAAILAGLFTYGVHIVKKANRADAAEARADAAEAGRAEDMREIAKRLDESAADRKAFLGRLDAIDTKFANLKIPAPKELVQHNEVPSVQGKCDAPTVGSSFVGVWNAASAP